MLISVVQPGLLGDAGECPLVPHKSARSEDQSSRKSPPLARVGKVGDMRALIPTKIVIYVTLQSIASTTSHIAPAMCSRMF